jgi:hypothetical protein
LFYQLEYAYLYYLIDRMSYLKKNQSPPNEYIGDEALRLIKTIFEMKSLDFSSLPHSWVRQPLSTERQDYYCNRYLETLKFNRIDFPSNDFDNLRNILKEIATDREELTSSFVLYWIDSESDWADWDGTTLLLFDQIGKRYWRIDSTYFQDVVRGSLLQCSQLFCHVISEALRTLELVEIDMPMDFLDVAAQALPTDYLWNRSTDLDDDYDGEDYTQTLIPLVVVRRESIIPLIGIDSTISAEVIWYIAGFSGLALWSNFDPHALMREVNSGLEICELEDSNKHDVSSFVIALGVIVKALSRNGAPSLQEKSAVFEVKLFSYSHCLVGQCYISELMMGSLTPLSEMIGESSLCDGLYYSFASPKLFSADSVIPVDFNSPTYTDLLTFLKEASSIQIFTDDGNLETVFSVPSHPNDKTIICAETYLIRGIIRGEVRMYRGVYNLKLLKKKRIPLIYKTFISSLDDQQIVALAIDAAEEGFDQMGRFAISDPLNFYFETYGSGRSFLAKADNVLINEERSSYFYLDLANFGVITPEKRAWISSKKHEWKEAVFSLRQASPGSIFKVRHELAKRLEQCTREFKDLDLIEPIREALVETFILDDDKLYEIAYVSIFSTEGQYLKDDVELPDGFFEHFLLQIAVDLSREENK